MTNGLEKMIIVAYEDPLYQEEVQNGTFTVQVNPESYSSKFKIEYGFHQPPGSSSQQLKFNKIKPEQMEFEFLFDKTGALPNTFSKNDLATIEKEREQGIKPDLQKFKDTLISYDGDIHQPYYLRLSWGSLLFKGVLLDMEIKFKLFLPSGTPLRAVATCKFECSVETERRVREENDRSPDITRMRTVKAGDTLPLLVAKLYKDPSYYIKVAQANKLVNFRNLKPGQQIVFPPVKKEVGNG
ncbi:MAG: LysM peptidoglycan-binding domain-containing protein [Bacteroidota bacterium]